MSESKKTYYCPSPLATEISQAFWKVETELAARVAMAESTQQVKEAAEWAWAHPTWREARKTGVVPYLDDEKVNRELYFHNHLWQCDSRELINYATSGQEEWDVAVEAAAEALEQGRELTPPQRLLIAKLLRSSPPRRKRGRNPVTQARNYQLGRMIFRINDCDPSGFPLSHTSRNPQTAFTLVAEVTGVHEPSVIKAWEESGVGRFRRLRNLLIPPT